MKRTPWAIAVLAIFFVGASSSAKAQTISLDFASGTLPITGPYGTVTVEQINPDTVQIIFDASSGLDMHNSDFGFNATNTTGDTFSIFSYTVGIGNPGAPTLVFGNQQLDGFGNFAITGSGGTGSSSGYSQIIVQITNPNGVLASNFLGTNNDGVQFAEQIGSACGTGFAGSQVGKSTGGTGSATCGSTSSPVPEPGTLTLLGTGLIGLAGLMRRYGAKKA